MTSSSHSVGARSRRFMTACRVLNDALSRTPLMLLYPVALASKFRSRHSRGA